MKFAMGYVFLQSPEIIFTFTSFLKRFAQYDSYALLNEKIGRSLSPPPSNTLRVETHFVETTILFFFYF